ncbi:MAG: right-handed parallel beta-helix repeat-containing protein [Patescibacteria group bacterium]
MANTFYLDAEHGDDGASGTTPSQAWRTLARAMEQPLRPGDALLLKRGCVWQGTFRLRGRGERGRPITLGTYGAGPKPRLVADAYPVIGNDGPVSFWHIKGLELRGAEAYDPHGREPRQEHGIHIHHAGGAASCGMVIEDCVIHDLGGTGIVFSAGELGATAHRGFCVTRCEIYNAGTGIATHGPWPPGSDLARIHPCHADFRVEHCQVHDLAADGIVLSCCQDGVIEHCRAWRTGIGRVRRTPVGIWYYLAARCLIQFCESYDNHTAGGEADGGGFDLDGGCIDCIMQYNYSHDNDGAGFLICSYNPADAPTAGCVTRYNLSVNDGRMNDYASIFIWQADGCLTHNNTCITRISSCLKFTSDSRGHLFANNIFVVDAAADIPVLQSAFGLNENRFEHNLYWRTGGGVSFRLKDAPRVEFADAAAFFQSKNELYADPRLSALSGPDIHLLQGSPALGRGRRLEDMGGRDLYGLPVGKRGAVNIGASQRRPRGPAAAGPYPS